MKSLKRYDGHRSHISGNRTKRFLQKIEKEWEFKRWEKRHDNGICFLPQARKQDPHKGM